MNTGLLAKRGAERAAVSGPQGTAMEGTGGGGAAADAADQDAPPNVSPEEQAEYTAFVETALNLITDDGSEQAILGSLKGSKDPVLSLASTALNVVKRVEAAAAAKGTKVPGEIILHGGEEIVSALAEMAGAAQIHDYTPEEISGAFYRAADMYREDKQSRGEIDEAAAKSDLEELKAADASGQLDQVVPGARQAMGA